ncbi:MAG: hypothetical protein LWW85_13070 [Marinilabiliales bacterium]|nr:hypothetical protein [Marinilabiliales bacterium]
MDNKRLVALDAFRGMVIAAMILVNYPGNWKAMYAPLAHATWEGTTPTDFIFPFFVFMVGISVALSFTKQLGQGKRNSEMIRKIVLRTAAIFAIGLALKLLPNLDFSKVELPGVLQRIALVYFACALLFLYGNWKTHLYVGIAILLIYWALLSWIPVPGFGPGVLEPGKNLANWLDSQVIPLSLLNKKGYDAEGVLSTLPAIVSGITGLLAGRMILFRKSKERLALNLFATGTLLILAGGIWGWYFPIIKKIWTSSYVLLTSGWAFTLFGLLYWIIEIRMVTKWTKPFVIFGSNAIAIYVIADIFETIFLKSGLHDTAYPAMTEAGLSLQAASLIWAMFSVAVCFLTSWILWTKRIFIKL